MKMYPIEIHRDSGRLMRPEVAQQPIHSALLHGANSKHKHSRSSLVVLANSASSNRIRFKKQWRRPKLVSAELQHEFNSLFEANQCNEQDENEREQQQQQQAEENAPTASSKVPWVFGYPGYFRPTGSRLIASVHREVLTDLPVHYWFYLFAYSSDVEALLKPFRESDKKCQMDKRLLCLMRRNRVELHLRDLELYKSLPRRVIVIKAPDWDHVLSTLADLEVTLPEVMRFASYPLLMETDTTRFPCTSNLTTFFTRRTSPSF